MQILSSRNTLVFVLSVLTLVLSFGFTGCKKNPLIGGFEAKVQPNLESVKAQLNFGKGVVSDLGGTFAVKDYGLIEIEPSTPDSPFNVGFRLNLDIVNDQDYVEFEPTTLLPSGQPIPIAINRAMAQVKLENELNSNFDVYAYVDILGKEWVGMVMTLKFIDNRYFPPGLSVSKGFLKDKAGHPRGVGAVFGPKVGRRNEVLVPGGIAVFANLKSLIDDARGRSSLALFDTKGTPYVFQGTNAAYYRDHKREAYHLEQAFKHVLRENMRTVKKGRAGH